MTSQAYLNAQTMRARSTVLNFGARLDGVTDDTAAVLAMNASNGYAIIPPGVCRLSTIASAIGNLALEPGASLSIDNGVTLNVEGLVFAPREWIFRGLGSVLFGGDPTTNTYSMAREAEAEWFGLQAGSGADQYPYLAAANAAMGTTREGVIRVPLGTITMLTFPVMNRGVKLLGKGSRLTSFLMPADGVAGFVTGGVACRFEGFQFDIAGGSYKNGGILIDLQHQDCVVEDVSFAACTNAIRVAGSNCRVRKILNTAQPSVLQAGSYLVNLQASDVLAEDINVRGSASQYLERIVRVEAPSAGISRWTVRDVDTTVTGAIAVGLVGGSNGIANGTIDGVQQGGTSSVSVDITHPGSSSIHEILIGNVQTSPLATAAFTMNMSGSGSVSHVTFSKFAAGAGLATGLSFTQSAGTVSGITVGDDVDLSGCTNPFVFNLTGGTWTPPEISPMAQAIRRNVPSVLRPSPLATNSVFMFDTQVQLFDSIVEVAVNNTEYGRYFMRAATSPTCNPIPNTTPSTNMANTTGALTGTTGASGKFTVSTDATGKLYFENRLAGSANVTINIASGIQSPVL